MQAELYRKLISDSNLKNVELERQFSEYQIDVYAEQKRGKPLIIEIGNIKESKLRFLRELDRKGEIKFIHIRFPKAVVKRKTIKKHIHHTPNYLFLHRNTF